MAKLSKAQMRVLAAVSERDGYYSAWSLGTRTCEALRLKGLVKKISGDTPFRTGWRDNGDVYITEAGRSTMTHGGHNG